jgi:transcriptional regulator with XRE-family HTH domain
MYLDSEKVESERLSRGWTQQQLADACGVSLRTIQRVEKQGQASLDTTSALVSVYGVARQELLKLSAAEEVREVSQMSWLSIAIGLGLGLLLGVLITLTV